MVTDVPTKCISMLRSSKNGSINSQIKNKSFHVSDRVFCNFIVFFLTATIQQERRQRVKIGDVLSDWLQLSAGMPQGSYLGPLTFIILIDALRPGCLTHKYVDDTTTTQFMSRSAVSSMQSFVDELVQQATDAGMIVNDRKTKELLIGSVIKDPPPPSV